MKRISLSGLFLCLTTTILFAQFAPVPIMPTGPRNADRLHGAFPFPAQEQFEPSGLPRGVPSLSRGRIRTASPGGLARAMFRSPDSGLNPTFLAAPTYNSGGEFARSVTAADVNGDGKSDLIVVNEFASNSGEIGTVGVLLGNGDGTFRPAVTYGYNGDQASSVVVADVNGDGKPDILVGIACATIPDCDNGGVGVLLGNGDGTFQPAVTYISGEYDAQSLAVADVNGDGRLDLLVTYYCDLHNCSGTHGGVSVLLGNGDGTFQPAVPYDSGGYATTSLAVGDVNGDGKPDLLLGSCGSSGNCEDGGVTVLLGNGNGTFQPATTCYAGGQPSFVAVADVNGDGKLDLLVGESGVAVLLGNGDGTFQTAATYNSGGQYLISLAVADVNGDGKLDLLVANECVIGGNCDDGNEGILLGNGDGSFQSPLAYDSGGNDASAVAVGDVNGDGKIDLLAVNECVSSSNCDNGEVAVLFGNGNGTFQAAENYNSGGNDASAVAVGDVNGDGKLDLLVASECFDGGCNYGSVGVLLGNGDGTLQSAFAYNSGGYDATSVAVADVNGDGKLDLLVTNLCSTNTNCGIIGGSTIGTVGVLLGNGDGTFQPAMIYDSGAANTTSVAVADVNGDGKLDLLLANECLTSDNCASDGVSVLLGNGDGTFQQAVTYNSGGFTASNGAGGLPSVAVADVNGDGKADLLVTNEFAAGNEANGTVGVLLGNGDGTFQPVVAYSSGGQSASSVAVGDVNGDGKFDLLVANECLIGGNCSGSGNGSVGVLLGNGDGTFQPAAPVVTPGQNIGALAIADFNGDGKLDVASGAGGVLLLGNGDGTFQPALALGAFGSGIGVGDLSGDGKPDIAVGGLTVLLNISSGFRYATTTVISSSPNPSGVGQPVTLGAVITPAFNAAGPPTGDVTFYDGAQALGTAAVSNGKATASTSSLSLGTHSITASYSGDINYLTSTSAPLTQVVNKDSTTTSVVSSMNPSVFGKPVTFTTLVTSSAGTPTGKIEFLNGATVLATLTLTSGSAKYTTSKLPLGANSITAVYEGDSQNSRSTSPPLKEIVLGPTETTLTSSPNPSAYGQTVAFTATVAFHAGTPTDSEIVMFMTGRTILGRALLSGGSASFVTSTLDLGTTMVTAVYIGDSNFGGSTSKAAKQEVNKATTTTTLASLQNPSTVGQSVTFIASVTPEFSGTVKGTLTFYDGTTPLKTVSVSGGTAQFTTSRLTSGTHNITAVYNGCDKFTGSSASLSQMVH